MLADMIPDSLMPDETVVEQSRRSSVRFFGHMLERRGMDVITVQVAFTCFSTYEKHCVLLAPSPFPPTPFVICEHIFA